MQRSMRWESWSNPDSDSPTPFPNVTNFGLHPSSAADASYRCGFLPRVLGFDGFPGHFRCSFISHSRNVIPAAQTIASFQMKMRGSLKNDYYFIPL